MIIVHLYHHNSGKILYTTFCGVAVDTHRVNNVFALLVVRGTVSIYAYEEFCPTCVLLSAEYRHEVEHRGLIKKRII